MRHTLLFILLLFLFIPLSGQEITEYFVDVQELNIRSGPGTDYPVIGKYKKDQRLEVLKRSIAPWWIIRTEEGEIAYVNSNYVRSEKMEGWERVLHQTGDVPECSNVSPEYDFELDNFLRLKTGPGRDVIVKLMRMDSLSDYVTPNTPATCIRIAYVREGESHEFTNIPEGRYFIKTAYGLDFRKLVREDKCIVKFMELAYYELDNTIMDFHVENRQTHRSEEGDFDTWDAPSYEIKFHTGAGERDHTSPYLLDEEGFNE